MAAEGIMFSVVRPSVCPFVCYQSCEHNKMLKTDTSGAREEHEMISYCGESHEAVDLES